MKFPPALFACLLLTVLPVSAREFTVVTYNVENLFDADGAAVYEDYVETGEPDGYSPAKMARKLQTIGEVLKTFNDGRGPEVVAFNEIEMDFTPDTRVPDLAGFLDKYKDTTAQAMLTTGLNDEIRGLPSEALLLKHLEDIGLTGYHVAVGEDKPDLAALDPKNKTAHKKGQKNVLFSKFPIKAKISHPTLDARDILEATLDVEGYPFTVFVNHWKSGAGNAATEETRRENARTLRTRLDEIFATDPSADILLAGDFNSQYNQTQAYPEMGKTGINDVLGSQGDELATSTSRGLSLYNLWHELPPDERHSDQFGGRWGTLMQKMITPGLYDHKGIQYVDNSFTVVILDGVNAVTPLRIPRRWTNLGEGHGASDHFPVSARFRTTGDGDAAKRLTLENPGQPGAPGEVSLVYREVEPSDCPEFTPAMGKNPGPHMGDLFRVRGSVASQQPLVISAHGAEYSLWTTDKSNDALERVRSLDRGAKIEFLGVLARHRNRMQFLVEHPSWLIEVPERK